MGFKDQNAENATVTVVEIDSKAFGYIQVYRRYSTYYVIHNSKRTEHSCESAVRYLAQLLNQT